MPEPRYVWKKLVDIVDNSSGFDPEPFSVWRRLRAGSDGAPTFLVHWPDGPPQIGQQVDGQPVRVPDVYRFSGRPFWTARGSKDALPQPSQRLYLPANPSPPAISGAAVLSGDVSLRFQDWQLTRLLRAAPAIQFKLDGAPAEPPQELKAQSVLPDPSLPARAPAGVAGPPVIAVIDDTCAYLNARFRQPTNAGRTRILSLWDQNDDASHALEGGWKSVEGFDYGRELTSGAIDSLLSAAAAEGTTERATYRRMSFESLPDTMAWSHGTQVLALAGGSVDAFAVPGGAADEASALPLIIVQLPRKAVGHTHGLWLNTCVLDGLHFVLRRAPRNSPVVVNISMAGGLGPHDGSSLLERAIDDLVEAWGGRLTVVLAAGNARLGNMHITPQLEAGRACRFAVSTLSEDGTPNFVDMWSADPAAALRLRVSVKGPLGALATDLEVVPGEVFGLFPGAAAEDSKPLALAAMSRHGKAVNGRGTQAFLGTAATTNRPGAESAPLAEWACTLETASTTPVAVDIWLGRDDVPSGYEGRAQGQLQFDRGGPVPEMACTLSSLAGGRQPIVVGAYRWLTGHRPVMFEHSAAGGGRIRGPDVCGATALDDGPGAPDVWFFSDEPAPTGPPRNANQGTSMAAPFVTRRIANILARGGGTWMGREEVLVALGEEYALPGIAPPGQTQWTSSLWVSRQRLPAGAAGAVEENGGM